MTLDSLRTTLTCWPSDQLFLSSTTSCNETLTTLAESFSLGDSPWAPCSNLVDNLVGATVPPQLDPLMPSMLYLEPMLSTPFGASGRFYSHSPFAPRQTASSVEKSITMKVILSQLLSYPGMMAKGGRLPPFIFPPCAAKGIEATNKCCAKGLHRCLSRPLAICSSLIQSFDARIPGNTSFIWRSIYAETARFNREVKSIRISRIFKGNS